MKRALARSKITRRWAKRGTRPSASAESAHCPKQGKGAGLVPPACNTEAMNLHLVEIANVVAPGSHVVPLVDQAGWHLPARLVVPANITIIPLPPKCPELNPVENIWQYMRDSRLSNRVFKSYDDIGDHCCLDTLLDRPWKILSIGLRQWAHQF
jgi:transposase